HKNQIVRRTLTKCRFRLKPYGLNCCAGNIFSIDIEALAGKYNSENNTDRINKIFRIDRSENLFILSTNLHELIIKFFRGDS
ncbi:MAG: hypothetical protein LBT09_03820, partial [Planctomycetaceae bacterium]|nr:hypothetical protein [Planctomycetaceae bacterium]